MTRLALAALLALAACGGPPCEYEVRGACIEIDPDSPVDATGLREEAEAGIDAGLAYWTAPADALKGWTIIYQTLALEPFGFGRTYPSARTIRLARFSGCRSAALVHEIGHVAIGDGGHTDPRWPGAWDVTVCR